MSPYVKQIQQAIWEILYAEPEMESHIEYAGRLAPRVDVALMRAYWQGWDDGIAERGKILPSGAAGRGVLAALGELRGSHTPTPEPPQ